MNIDCVDGYSDPTMDMFHEQLGPAALRVDTVGQMVKAIEQQLGKDFLIRRLRIFGHGIPGAQGLGNSYHLFETALYRQITLEIGDRAEYANVLGRLRGKFEQHGWVELHGCSVGAGANGWNLLKALARLWQAKVAAGVVEQWTTPGFEGAYYRVAWPDGRVYARHGHIHD